MTFDGTQLQLGSGCNVDLSTNDVYLRSRVLHNPKSGGDGMYIGYNNANSGHTRIYGGGATSGGISVQGSGSGDCYVNGNVIWNSGNDGSGTGLDADTVDGIHGGSFLRSDTNDSMSGNLTVTGSVYLNSGFTLSQSNNNRNMKFHTQGTGDIGISGYDGNNNWCFQLYGTTSNSYGFLTSNWGSWDIRKTVNDQMYLRVGSSDRLVFHSGNESSINYNNLSNKPSVATVLYIDVYGQGNAGDRNTANSWAQSAVSIPNNTMYVVRWNYAYSYWVNNHTASGNEDRKTLWIKNSSGSIYYAGADST